MWTCPECGEEMEDRFDACWRCAGEPEPAPAPTSRLTWRFFVCGALAAVLAPLLADGLQSLLAVRRSPSVFSSVYLGGTPGTCVFVGVRAMMTFLALRFFVRLGFRDRTVWICLVILWFLADYGVMPVTHG